MRHRVESTRVTRGRRLVGGAGVAALLCGAVGCSSTATGGSNASCVGPHLDAQPPSGRYGAPAPTVHPGDTLTVFGHWYTSTCNDTGQDDPLRPLAPVRLTVRLPGGRVLPVGELTPHGEDVGFHCRVHVPASARSGVVTVSDHRRPQATFRFRVER